MCAGFQQRRVTFCDEVISKISTSRLCTHRRLHHVHHGVVCSPTQPSQPAESALCAEWHTTLLYHSQGYELSSWHMLGHNTQPRNSKFLAYPHTGQSLFFCSYTDTSIATCTNGLGMVIVHNLLRIYSFKFDFNMAKGMHLPSIL